RWLRWYSVRVSRNRRLRLCAAGRSLAPDHGRVGRTRAVPRRLPQRMVDEYDFGLMRTRWRGGRLPETEKVSGTESGRRLGRTGSASGVFALRPRLFPRPAART